VLILSAAFNSVNRLKTERKEGVYMKRFAIVSLVIIMILALVGCGNYIGSEGAIDVALKDLNINRVGAARTDATLDKDSDPVSYIVKIDLNDHVVTYIINAETGDIISQESTKK
jgi:uncharacterized membrane protein YkoI